jgi:replicative DNA helicase
MRGFAGIPEIVRDSFGTIDNLCAQQREITGLATRHQVFDKMTSWLPALRPCHHCRARIDLV